MLVLLGAAGQAQARAGDLDPSFSRDGWVRTGFGLQSATGEAVAVDSAGRIVVAGVSGSKRSSDGEGNAAVAVARFTPSGPLDAEFDGDGRTVIDLGPGVEVGDLELDPEGRILIAASTADNLVLLRLESDGSPDSSFGAGGIAVVDLGAEESGPDLALGPAGALFLAGSSCAEECRFALVRLTADGVPDPAFADHGAAITTFPGPGPVLGGIAAYPDGRVIAVGNVRDQTAVARYLPDGALDPSLNGSGLALISEYTTGGGHVALAADGLPVVLGSNYSRGVGPLFGLLDNGSLNPGFLPKSSTLNQAMAFDAEGRIVTAGWVGGCDRYCYPLDMAIDRSTPDGAHDPTFGGRWVAIADTGASRDVAYDVALQADGRIVATGYSGAKLVVARFEVEPGPRDADADAVEDEADVCPLRYSPGNDGCPEHGRTLTLHRRKAADLWVGRLRSGASRCAIGEKVRVVRLRPGADRLIGEARTGRDGRWKTDGSVRPGSYRAFVERELSPRAGFCDATRSNVFEIEARG